MPQLQESERISNLKSVGFWMFLINKLRNPPGTVQKGLYNDSLGKKLYRLLPAPGEKKNVTTVFQKISVCCFIGLQG